MPTRNRAPLCFALILLPACDLPSPPSDDPATSSDASASSDPTTASPSSTTAPADDGPPPDTGTPADTSAGSTVDETTTTADATTAESTCDSACGETTTPDETTDPSSDESSAETDPGTTSDDPSSSSGVDPGPFACDLWSQDCPDDEKCAPWADDGGDQWNATRCIPVADDPAQTGDACVIEGDAHSGLDDCDVGAVCWDSPVYGLYCLPLCVGAPDDPVCEDPSSVCSLEGVASVCLPLEGGR